MTIHFLALLNPGLGPSLANVTTPDSPYYYFRTRSPFYRTSLPRTKRPAPGLILAASQVPLPAMDLAYDHIQEEALKPEETAKSDEKRSESTLNDDFQEAYKAISSSPWGARLGGFFGNVVKQVYPSPPLSYSTRLLRPYRANPSTRKLSKSSPRSARKLPRASPISALRSSIAPAASRKPRRPPTRLQRIRRERPERARAQPRMPRRHPKVCLLVSAARPPND